MLVHALHQRSHEIRLVHEQVLDGVPRQRRSDVLLQNLQLRLPVVSRETVQNERGEGKKENEYDRIEDYICEEEKVRT